MGYYVTMNRNKLDIAEICEITQKLKNSEEIEKFFSEIFTQNELEVLERRWRILKMLSSGKTQREVAKNLNVSLCNVTRGAKILKDHTAVVSKYMIKE